MKKRHIIISIIMLLIFASMIMPVKSYENYTYTIGRLFGNFEIHTDVNEYSLYIGENAKEKYVNKWGVDESIFPSEITESMNIKDYKMIYCDPWDAQYISLLYAEYTEADYQSEVARLQEYKSDDYLGVYGAEGFHKDYQLLAIHVDQYNGLVYALTDGEDEIIYVEMIFCNYFMDVDYEKYIDKEFLPIGFDATPGNAYRDEIMN